MDEKLMQAETASAETASEKKKKLPGIGGKRKKRWLFLLAAVVLLAAALLGSRMLKLGKGGTVRDSGYQAAAVLQRDLSVTVTGTATLEPADAYQVGTLVSGTILSAPFEEDQRVEKDTLLYTLDSGDAQNSVARANISVEQAQLTKSAASFTVMGGSASLMFSAT